MARIAESLEQLRRQLNAMAPNRSKVSDGGVGDAAHAARKSDHNPDGGGVVHARDFTHDPAGGLDCNWLAQQLTAGGDRRIKYIIWNARIWQDGTWKNYTGENAHRHHLHLSVVSGAAGESAAPWNLGSGHDEGDDFLMGLSQGDQNLIVTAAKRTMGMLQQRYYKKNPDGTVAQSGADGTPCAALDSLDGNFIVRQIWDTQKLLVQVNATVTAMAGGQVTDDDLSRKLKELEDKFAPVLATLTPETREKTS